MKYIVGSDIHGSLKYTKLFLEAFQNEKADEILLLGDILYHGPRNDLPEEYNPKEVIKLLNGLKDKIVCVQGNCDAYVDQMVLEFPILSSSCIQFNGTNFYMTHGHIFNPDFPLNVDSGVVLYGHTHVADIKEVGKVLYVNPGSISIPKVHLIHSYAIIDDKHITIKDFEGNVFKTISYR